MERHELPMTQAVSEYLIILENKRKEIAEWDGWSMAPGVRDARWREGGRPGRSLIIRVSIHGLHSEFCSRNRCFEAAIECICRYCGNTCEQLHVWNCPGPQAEMLRVEIKKAERYSLAPEDVIGNEEDE